MTNAPGNGWPGAPPPQGPGSRSPEWGGQPWTGTPNPGQQQQAQGYPGQPTQPPGTQPAFDPTRALGEAAPQSVSIDQFRPPNNRTPLLITIVALVTLVLVIAGGLYIRSQPGQPEASSTPTQSTPAGPGQKFETPTGQQQGRWEILDQQWTDEGLQLQLRIYSDKGPISFSFMAFTNASTQIVDPANSPVSPDIRTGTTTPAKPVTGYVFFPMPKGDATIILATGTGRQMSALPVKG